MKRTLTPNPFEHRNHLETAINLIYNKASKIVTMEEIEYYPYSRTRRPYKFIFKYSGVTENEYYNLTFMDCINKTNSDTHIEFYKFLYKH